MENKQMVYQAIKSIADNLCKEDKTYLRADLAFELKKYGIASDSSEVSKLVFDAYRFFHNDGNISIAFVSNNSRTTLVAEYQLNDSLEQGNKEEALKIAETELTLSSSALEQLKEQVEQNLSLVLAKGTSKMADVVMGTNGVKNVRSKASAMFDKYTRMVEAYHYAEDSVRGNIEDFTSLRSDMGMVYRDYAMKLIDIYGDSIKMVQPDLFDFKRIEWLDVDEMLKYVELEYNKLSEKCAALMGEISDNFRASLQTSLLAYKSASNGNKSLGLAMAGLAMLDHYMGASERTNRLKTDLSVFQTSVKHDATRIKADMGRLMVICKTLNDVIIPKANVFMRYGEKLMASDLKAMLDTLYADEAVRPLEEKRRELLQRLKTLDMEMNDHLQNIDVYTSLINDITSTLESKRASYMDAKEKKPSKPFFLVNWLTFGTANKNYYRNYAEWNDNCFPLIREYESYQVDLKLDKDELASHREEQTRIKNEYAKLSNELNKVSDTLRSKIVCSDELKLKMLKHLRDMVAMLKLGREIMESKIDEKWVHTVDIPNFKVGLTYSWGKLAIYGNMVFGRSESRTKTAENDYGRDATVESMSESTDKGHYYMPKLGFDLNISPKQYLGVEWSGSYSKNYSNDCRVNSTVADRSAHTANIRSFAPYTLRDNNNNLTLNYEWKTDTLGSRLNIVADYAGKRERDVYKYENNYNLSGGSDSIISKSQPSYEYIDIYSAQVDFAKILKRHQLTIGAKYVYADIGYNSRIHLGNTTLGGVLSEDIDQRDDFKYFERRYAVYGMYRYTARPWEVQMGVRDEYTEWETCQRVKDKLRNKRTDNTLFPSFFVRRDVGEGNALSLSYTQSVNRPSYQMVNPFVFHLSETSYKEGNPNLRGELLYNAALQFVLKSRYVLSLSALFIDRKINEMYEQIGERQTRYTLKNDGTTKRLVLYMGIPFTWGVWNCRNNVELSESWYENSAKRVNDFGIVLSSFNRFRLSKQFTAMANVRYVRHYKQLYLIQKTDYVGVDVEGDYSCFKDRLNVNFGVKDLLNSRGKNRQVFRNGGFEHHSDFHFLSRKLFVSLTYSFSAGTKRTSRHDKTYSNEEDKERM